MVKRLLITILMSEITIQEEVSCRTKIGGKITGGMDIVVNNISE